MVKNIMLIDRSIDGYEILSESCNENTLPVMYSSKSTKSEILTIMNQFSNIDRLSFAFHYSPMYIFLDGEPLFEEKANEIQISNNVDFLIDLIKRKNIKNVDFLACNTLAHNNWKKYYETLEKNTNVIIGASSDTTGNIKYGGNWIMENTKEDIESIYFSKNIEYYS
jgi:hypothetical protein